MKTTVLYIEDNDLNFYLMNYILKAHGYDVIRGKDGREGIEIASRTPLHLILLDIQLPGMDGYKTARELRKMPEHADTPLVALTSYAMAGDREKALSAGCTGYIEKPINPATFIQEIKAYLLPNTDGDLPE